MPRPPARTVEDESKKTEKWGSSRLRLIGARIARSVDKPKVAHRQALTGLPSKDEVKSQREAAISGTPEASELTEIDKALSICSGAADSATAMLV